MGRLNEVRPCPWCGKAPVIRKTRNAHNRKSFVVGCYNDVCEVGPETFLYPTQREAVDAWNRYGETLASLSKQKEEADG